MKKYMLLIIAVLLFPVLASAQQESDGRVFSVPQIGILDVISGSFNESERSMFTDILRTEIFKINYFTIVERGMIQEILNEHKISMDGLTDDSQLINIGRFLSVEKLLICKIETFADTIVINLRIIDVNTSLLDYTENVFISDKNQVFQALADLALELQLHYLSKDGSMTPEKKQEALSQNWLYLGADSGDLNYLISENINPSEYLEIRQYDITFTVKDFLALNEMGWDIAIIKEFFREGIDYNEVNEALQLGIADLKNYRESFKGRGLSFSEYLDAYRNHIVSPLAYKEFQKGYDKDYLSLGIGGVANSLPVLNADFSFLIGQLGWEHYISDFQRGTMNYSLEMGTFLMNGYLPAPYFQGNYYLGNYPFYGKLSMGILWEALLGNHVGAYACLGMELNSSFEFTIMATFAGTQPTVSYADFETTLDDPDYVNIVFPYFGVFIHYKISRFNFD